MSSPIESLEADIRVKTYLATVTEQSARNAMLSYLRFSEN